MAGQKNRNNIFYRIAATGADVLSNIGFMGFALLLLFKSLYHFKSLWRKRHEVLTQMYHAGVKTFPVITIVALFTGMILALQVGVELRVFQQESLVAPLIMATLTREVGSLMAAIVLIASMGSAMAAEIGTMKVSEEIDALEFMGINPVNFLVMPRVAAMLIMTPMTAVYVIIMGAMGGAIISEAQLGVAFDVYYYNALQGLNLKAIYTGMFKAVVFGLTIASVSCAYGLQATNGATGVGKCTRNSVISCFILVLIFGYMITSIFYGSGS